MMIAIMWIGKNAKAATGSSRGNASAPAAAPRREIHVAHIVEALVGDFLIKHRRLERSKSGRHVLHFIGANQQRDGTTDYTVRTRVGAHGMERTLESTVRIDSRGALTLLR